MKFFVLLCVLCGAAHAEVGDIFVSDEEYRAYKATEAKTERYVDPLVKIIREHNRAMDEWDDGKKSIAARKRPAHGRAERPRRSIRVRVQVLIEWE
jgi:hypothetical protein